MVEVAGENSTEKALLYCGYLLIINTRMETQDARNIMTLFIVKLYCASIGTELPHNTNQYVHLLVTSHFSVSIKQDIGLTKKMYVKWMKLNSRGSNLLVTCEFRPHGSEDVFFSYLWRPVKAGDHPVLGPALVCELSVQGQLCTSLHVTATHTQARAQEV